jgi:hypothetical protein
MQNSHCNDFQWATREHRQVNESGKQSVNKTRSLVKKQKLQEEPNGSPGTKEANDWNEEFSRALRIDLIMKKKELAKSKKGHLKLGGRTKRKKVHLWKHKSKPIYTYIMEFQKKKKGRNLLK